MAYFTEILTSPKFQYRISGPDVDIRGVTHGSFFGGVTFEFGLWDRGHKLPHTEIKVSVDLKKKPPFDEQKIRREAAEVLVANLENIVGDLRAALKDPSKRSFFGPIPPA